MSCPCCSGADSLCDRFGRSGSSLIWAVCAARDSTRRATAQRIRRFNSAVRRNRRVPADLPGVSILTTSRQRENSAGLRPDLRVRRFHADDIDAQCASLAHGRPDHARPNAAHAGALDHALHRRLRQQMRAPAGAGRRAAHSRRLRGGRQRPARCGRSGGAGACRGQSAARCPGVPAGQPLLRDRPDDGQGLGAVRPRACRAGAGCRRSATSSTRTSASAIITPIPPAAPPARSRSSAGSVATSPISPSRSAAASISRRATAPAIWATSGCRRIRRRWISAPGSRRSSAGAGSPSTPATTCRRIGRVLIARGRDAADVAISTTFGSNVLKSFSVITHEAGDPAAAAGWQSRVAEEISMPAPVGVVGEPSEPQRASIALDDPEGCGRARRRAAQRSSASEPLDDPASPPAGRPRPCR